MEMRHLRAFVAVAEELHFGRAAERLHIAGPPLSKQIQQLERELGFALFKRSTRHVSLTAGGAVYLERVQRLLQDLETARTDGTRANRGETGHLSVGFAGSATYDLLPRLTRRFRDLYPGVQVELRGEMVSPRQIDALREGRLDVGFVRHTGHPEEIVSETVWREPLTAVLPADHPLAGRSEIDVAELRDEPFLVFGDATNLREAVRRTCDRAGFTPHVVDHASESFALACLVASGLGVALMPTAARHLELPGVRYVPIPAHQSEIVTLEMVWHRHNLSPVTQNFLAVARQARADYDPTGNNRAR